MNTEYIQKMNYLGSRHIPFIFIIDYEQKNCVVEPVSDLDNQAILFNIDGFSNCGLEKNSGPGSMGTEVVKSPVSFDQYSHSFNIARNALEKGDSYLLNLTQPTNISTGLGLRDIFHRCSARYRLFYRDSFVVFSPECFVAIENGVISSFPMKGTIDAALPGAREILMNDEKEIAEHVTIVDLIRNDLNMVAHNVRVPDFRYAEVIPAGRGSIISTSSKICGDLAPDYPEHIGSIIASLLPAGSVTGAPKKRTVEIIREAECYERGFYTGVFGYSDGVTLNSAVMIRFIEKQGDKLVYKSGGGITVYSNAESEYREMIDKVYVPIG